MRKPLFMACELVQYKSGFTITEDGWKVLGLWYYIINASY